MHSKRSGLTVAVLIVFIGAPAGCSTASGARAPGSLAARYRTPEQAALSWFYAVNHKDDGAAVGHFEHSAAGQMDWGDGNTSTWPTFSRLHCKQVADQAFSASVYCTFRESLAPAAGNPDTFWTIDLRRQTSGRWLIAGYGQG